MFLLLQLAGTAVLAVGLWLRFDSRTAGLFEGEDSPSVFFTGKAAGAGKTPDAKHSHENKKGMKENLRTEVMVSCVQLHPQGATRKSHMASSCG